ncbi:MAG: sporulation protein YabP [Lachnospiraceae bacterium]|jgi:sporulation protein YabP|nr:sporulation protein YabP [Lachnospiraceae bacterium]RKJ49374.1 sporulation protein YabP [bacterium 1XD42-54]
MEEKKNLKPHSIMWKDRKQGSVTGVTDVVSFDDGCVVLETEQGMLTLKGKDMHVGRLLLDQGEVELEGEIESAVYSGQSPAKKGSMLKRMFR